MKDMRVWYSFLWLLSAMFVASSCQTEEIINQDTKSDSGVEVMFSASFAGVGIDFDTDIVPMGLSRADEGKNFCLYSSELVIFRRPEKEVIGGVDNYYKVVRIFQSKASSGKIEAEFINKDETYQLKDLGLDVNPIVLQPGNYTASLIINGPKRYYGESIIEGNYYPSDLSVIDGPADYLQNMRDCYYQCMNFEVKKTDELGEENFLSFTFDELKRKAAPIRFLFQSKSEYMQSVAAPEIICSIAATDPSSVPVGCWVNGNFIISERRNPLLIENRGVVLPSKWKMKDPSMDCFLPNYSEISASSIFLLATQDPSPVDITFTGIKDVGGSRPLFEGKFESTTIKNVKVQAGHVTNIVLTLVQDEGGIFKIEPSNKPEDLEEIKQKWEEQYPSIPFSYLEFYSLQ